MSMLKTGYSSEQLREALREVGVGPGRTIYVTGNFGKLGFPSLDGATPVTDKSAILDHHLNTLLDLIGPNGNLVFPTHSWNLVGSNAVFDPETTPADYVFSEHVRCNLKVRRQFHPFASVAAFGPQQDEIIQPGISKDPYGHGSPFDKLNQADALHVSFGLPVRLTISAVHHCEFLAEVPYRYNKSFHAPCKTPDGISNLEFHLFVMYRNSELKRDRNRKILGLKPNCSHLKSSTLGRGMLQSVPLSIFIPETIKAMREHPYIWLTEDPLVGQWEP